MSVDGPKSTPPGKSCACVPPPMAIGLPASPVTSRQTARRLWTSLPSSGARWGSLGISVVAAIAAPLARSKIAVRSARLFSISAFEMPRGGRMLTSASGAPSF